jgi:hypothetical protein
VVIASNWQKAKISLRPSTHAFISMSHTCRWRSGKERFLKFKLLTSPHCSFCLSVAFKFLNHVTVTIPVRTLWWPWRALCNNKAEGMRNFELWAVFPFCPYSVCYCMVEKYKHLLSMYGYRTWHSKMAAVQYLYMSQFVLIMHHWI